VDKIIIDQDSLSKFINTISPRAYHSVTRIDFAALDRSLLKILGIYGSKAEIVRLLRSLNAITDAMYVLLSTLISLLAYYSI
jgi:hypothetical protein